MSVSELIFWCLVTSIVGATTVVIIYEGVKSRRVLRKTINRLSDLEMETLNKFASSNVGGCNYVGGFKVATVKHEGCNGCYLSKVTSRVKCRHEGGEIDLCTRFVQDTRELPCTRNNSPKQVSFVKL